MTAGAVATAQLPLPIGPAGSVAIGLACCLVEGDAGGAVFINGQICFAWDAGDVVGRKIAAVQLVRIKAASQREVAAGFGVAPNTVYGWRCEVGAGGVAALSPVKHGPKGPSKLTDEVIADIVARRAAGATITQLAAAVGCSPRSVASVLAAAHTRPAPDTAAGEVDAGDGAQEIAAGGPDAVAGERADRQDGGAVVAVRDLPVLPDAVDRSVERALSRFGLIDFARPVFAPAARVPLAGLLLAIPGLVATGLIETARRIYGVRKGFYGLASMMIEQVLRALAGEPRAEGATRINPTDLGRVLGLDRSPEVQTVRRVLRELAAAGKAAELQTALAARYLAASADVSAVLYVDGHVRVYQGTRKIQKMHVARLKFPAPATAETWICDGSGAPVWMVMAEPGASLAAEIGRLLPDVRKLVGDGRRVLVGFDRGGWSPALFKTMIESGFDIVTWRKGDADNVDEMLFTGQVFVDDTGAAHRFLLAETTVTLPIDESAPASGGVSLRQITVKDVDGHQAHILTSATDLSAIEVAWRMVSRWRQENYFRYSRIHLALDAHDTYRAEDDDPDRLVPNPAKKTAFARVQNDRARLTRAEQVADRQFLAIATPDAGKSTLTSEMHNAIIAPVIDAETRLAASQADHRATPARLPLSQVRPGQQILDVETKLLTHAIRMAAFNTQATLARAVKTATGYARADDEANALIRAALKLSGDIDPAHGVLNVRLDPMATARQTQAIAELCDALNQAHAVYPDTNLKLHYTVKTDTRDHSPTTAL